MTNEDAQKAGTEVERRMIAVLLDMHSCGELRVRDVQYIAERARIYAYEAIKAVEASK